jgi:hypothetical protein
MLLYRPRFRHPERAAKPPNLAEAESIAPGINPVFAEPADLAVDVETPSGQVLGVDDPALMSLLSKRMRDGPALTLRRSERAITDCRPISLFSIQTVRQLGEESRQEGIRAGLVDPPKVRFVGKAARRRAARLGSLQDAAVPRRQRAGQVRGQGLLNNLQEHARARGRAHPPAPSARPSRRPGSAAASSMSPGGPILSACRRCRLRRIRPKRTTTPRSPSRRPALPP